MIKEDIYDEQIAPMMKEIIRICKEHKIAAFCSFALGPNEEAVDAVEEDGEPSTLWCTTSLPISERKLENDEVGKLYNVRYNQYDVVPSFQAFTITTHES